MALCERVGIAIKPLSLFDAEVQNGQLLFRVVRVDRDHLRIEHLTDFLSHEIVNSLHVEPGRQPLLHAVDDGKFGIALLCFFQKVLGFVEETGIFQRHTHRICQRGQQTQVRFRKGMIMIQVFKSDNAAKFHALDQRHINAGLRRLCPRDIHRPKGVQLCFAVETKRFARIDNPTEDRSRRHRWERTADTALHSVQ